MVSPSAALRRGGVMRFDLGGQPVVLFRGRDNGAVHALPGHCDHQGVDLAHGSVVGDVLRCPLHHWEYTNRCVRIPGAARAPRTPARYHAAERFGMIFIHTGANPDYAIPGFTADDAQLHFRAGKAVEVACPWYVPVANAFDMGHLQTVHRRRLTSTPEIDYPDPRTFHVRYTTAVTGNGWSDRAMQRLSGNDIRVDVTCSAGAIIMVESSIRRWRGYLMVSLRPTAKGVSILPLFGVPRGGLHALHARVAAALFTAFLIRDVQALSGIRFPAGFLDNHDPTINACYRYLCELPETEELS
ncbi:MAG TPA: Rieske 2Fe-2S domain-containing protein [Thermoanaerobaculia bacterium]|jgi:nitrite reductase/ring-hydroxylating ferredoxin subunit|nr:Rieske 2Fe-2S domain-containing protein [Thermoanaerobaculia bacterium]